MIGAALFAAVAIAAGGFFGHVVSDRDGFSFEINGETVAGGAAAGSGVAATRPAAGYAARELRVRNAAAILNVVPEDRTDISLEIANPGRLKMPTVRLEGDVLIVDGGVRANCRGEGETIAVSVRGVGEVSGAQMPTITVRAPRAVKLSAGGAVYTRVAPSASADVSFAGCGDARLGDVAGALALNTSGSGAVTAGAAQSAEVNLDGSGDASLGAVAGKLEIALAGSGGVTAASLSGPLEVSIAGSGDVAVNGGAVGDADISIAGSGGVRVGAPVRALSVSIAGSGDVDVAGAATSLDANIMGSGDVRVASVSGTVEKSVMGSGSVIVGAP